MIHTKTEKRVPLRKKDDRMSLGQVESEIIVRYPNGGRGLEGSCVPKSGVYWEPS